MPYGKTKCLRRDCSVCDLKLYEVSRCVRTGGFRLRRRLSFVAGTPRRQTEKCNFHKQALGRRTGTDRHSAIREDLLLCLRQQSSGH